MWPRSAWPGIIAATIPWTSACCSPTGSSSCGASCRAPTAGSGTWYVHAGLGVADMFDRQSTPYFSIDAMWYHLLTDRLELRVLSKSQFDANGLFVVVPARISVAGSAGDAVGAESV